MSKKMTASKYVLFTNLRYVSVGPVRTYCHALLLEEFQDPFGDGLRRRMRGFGTDPSWPVFDMELPSIEYTSQPGRSQHIVIGVDDEVRPLSTGSIIEIKGGPSAQLVADNHRVPVVESTFEGDIDPVWRALYEKTAEHWTAPNMPLLQYVPAAVRRSRQWRW